jgi:hypothetical protein
MQLKHICEIKSNFPDADFWLIRKGSANKVGTPVKVFNPEHIGIKIKSEGKEFVIPQYLFYWFQHLQMRGFFAKHATGVLKLVHITSKFVGDLPAAFVKSEAKE